MPTQIKVVEDGDDWFFTTNAQIFIKTDTKQIQITFDADGGANLVQFEPVGGLITAGITSAPALVGEYEGVFVRQ